MNNDSIEELEGRKLERAAIVKWLRARAAAWRRPHTASVGYVQYNELADSVEGLAAAIERCAHRSEQQAAPKERSGLVKTVCAERSPQPVGPSRQVYAYCTRELGHDGNHVAETQETHTHNAEVVATWKRVRT